MPNTFDQVPETKSLQREAALGKLNSLFAHDFVFHTQKMYVAGIPIAFIFLMVFARVALRTVVIGKIIQLEFTL